LRFDNYLINEYDDDESITRVVSNVLYRLFIGRYLGDVVRSCACADVHHVLVYIRSVERAKVEVL